MGENKIAEISGDLKYSWMHLELFSLFGDSKHVVIRVWLGWQEKTCWTPFDDINIECSDFERLDFVVDTVNRSVCFVGTDFHYREYWCTVKELFDRVGIIHGPNTLFNSIKNLILM